MKIKLKILSIISILFLFISIPVFSETGQIQYGYDDLNRLVQVKYTNGAFIEYTYDAAGNRLSRQVSLPPDTIPPGTITTLTIATLTPTSITLNWTAPGDDGNIGTATLYEVRYATFTITDDNWDSATIAGTMTPKPAGSNETFTVTDLKPETTYYLAVKAQDNGGLWSGLSNVISITTLQYGSLSIASTPPGAKIYLNGIDTGSVTTKTFTNIPSGTHTIKLTLSGYNDWYWTAMVATGSTAYGYATMTPIPTTGTLSITSTPSGAKIYLDGVDTGQVTNYFISQNKIFNPEIVKKEIKETTGIDVVIKEGKVVSSEGKPIRNDINDGSSEAPQKSGIIKNIEQLPTYIIKLAMTKEGFSPLSFEVKAGQAVIIAVTSKDEQLHVFKFRDPSLSGTAIGVSSGMTRVLIFNAPEKTGEYEFFCEIPGHGDKEKGKMIVSPNVLEGTHTIKLTLPNYNDWYGTATVIAGSTAYVYATMTPIPTTGTLSITSNPSGAKIYLNGIDTGSVTTKTFTNIPSGTHTIKLTLSGYQDWYGTATVTACSTTDVYAALIPTTTSTTAIKVEIPSVSGGPGQTIEVLVRTPDDLTGKEVSSMDMIIKVDKNLLTPLSALATDTLTSSWGQPTYTIIDGTITIAMAGVTNLSGSGTLVRLLYQVNPSAISGGTCTIRFTNFIFNEGVPNHQISNGLFTVGSASSISGKTDYYFNQEPVTNATITLTGVATLATITNTTGRYQFTNIDNGNWVLSADKGGDVKTSISSYDASLILKYKVGLVNLNGYQMIAADTSGNGAVSSFDASQILKYKVGLITQLPVGKEWCFIPKAVFVGTENWASATRTIEYKPLNGDKIGQDFIGIIYGDVSGNWTEAKVMKAPSFLSQLTISIPDTSANPGSSIEIPIKVSDTTGLGVSSADIKLTYNPDVLIATITSVGTMASGWTLIPNLSLPGEVIIAMAGSNDLSGSGTLFSVTFNVIGSPNATSTIHFKEATFNEGIPSANPIDGIFTVTSLITTGSLTITSTPSEANILLDGVDKGTVTPAILADITPGTHTIKLTKQGYYDWTDSVTVTAGTTTSVFATLTLIDTIAPTFTVTVTPDPAGTGTLTIIITPNESLKATPTLTIKDSANATITTTLSGFLNGTYTYQATITSNNADGTATIIAHGTDLAENIGTTSKTFQISIPRILTPNAGTSQIATVTTILQPFVVKLTDNLNRPIQGHTIKWTLISAPASGILSSTITTTNAEGLASTTLTLGTKTGTYIVTAEGLLTATFTATATPGTLTQINVSPATAYVTVNQLFLFTAKGYDGHGNEIADLSYNWSKEGEIGTLTPSPAGTSATLQAVSIPTTGTITVATLTITGTITGITLVSIVYGELTSVTITPASSMVEMKGTRAFTAQAFNKDNSPMGATYTWTLKSTDMGTLNTTTGQTVVFTATKTGSVDLQVVAAFGTHTATATATITVVNGAVHHIDITPATATIEARGTSSFTAEAFNQYGYKLIGITQFNWQVIEGSGTITGSSGKTVVLATNNIVGTLTLTASTNTVTGMATVKVSHGSVSVVSVNSTSTEVKVMGSQTVVASAVNRFGHPIPASELSYTWGLNSGIGGSITPTTFATATFTAGSKTGKVDITAEAQGKRATVTVTVTAGPIAKLVFVVPPTAGTLTVGMPGEMYVQTQDEFDNPSPASATTIIVSGDAQSRFAEVAAGATWTTAGTFTKTSTSNLTFFFKQNGTSTPVIVTACIQGTSISGTHSVTILPLGSSSLGTVVGDDGQTRVEVGTDAVTGAGGYIEIDTSGTSTDNIVSIANTKDDADPRINRVEGTLRRFEIHNATITTTNLRIAIPYSDADNDGYVDGVTPAMQESSLAIYRLVGTGTDAFWKKIDSSQVDSIHNIVYADVQGFSFYILMGADDVPNLDKALVYPNPYDADKHAGIGITFDKLSENSTIQIFTIAGELVREIRVDSPQQRWDARNSAGERVASGIYIYLIKDSNGNKKSGKLGILR